MVTITGIYGKGYAAATTGGVSYILNLKEKVLNGVENPCISVVVIGEKKTKVNINLCSRLISPVTGISHWREDIKLTSDERKVILEWIKDNHIVEDAISMTKRYEANYVNSIEAHKSYMRHFELPRHDSLDQYNEWERIKEELDAEINRLRLEFNTLREMIVDGLPDDTI